MSVKIKILSFVNRLIPKNKRQIVIYGRRMINDNTEAILDYLISEGYNSKYNIRLCVVKDLNVDKYSGVPNLKIVTNPLATLYSIFRSMCMFHAHGMSACALIPCGGQKVFNLWHGSPLKNIGAGINQPMHPETDSFFLCASPFMAEINKKCFLISDKQVFIGSNPRNDIMLSPNQHPYVDELKKDGRKLVVFMPTFRNSKELGRNDSDRDFPLLNDNNIGEFDRFLGRLNLTFLVKPHPYQDNISLFEKDFKNIRVIKNDGIHRLGMTLYQLLGHADALVSDFSSVYFDYLLLNRPIGFVIDDMERYGDNRGFTIERPLDLMPGEKISDIEGLKNFLAGFLIGNDTWIEERERVNNLCNTFKTPDSSKRILDFLGLQK